MIEAVVFDFDGLVFDSETHEYDVVREIFREHGAELPLEVWGRCVGRASGWFDPFAHLEDCIGRPVDREALAALRHERFHARIQGQGPLPGVEATIDAARAHGLRVGLASSGTRRWVHGQLERLGLLHRFDAVRVREDVREVKPDPELYLSVLAALGVEPANAVAFEDSPNGALAARRAGMRCVVIPNAVTAGLEFGDTDLRLESMLDVQLPALFDRLLASEGGGPPDVASAEPSAA
ncbi:MAG: yhcW [Gemmatimonadetes bacterium]|nr:yhcW [Gemmatimonadota bacterium]